MEELEATPAVGDQVRAFVQRTASSAGATGRRLWREQRARAHDLKTRRTQRSAERHAHKDAHRPAVHGADVRRIDGVDLRPLGKVAATYYLCVLAVVFVASILFWLFASAVGIVGNIEQFVREVGFGGFRFVPIQLFLGLAILGLAWVAAMTVLTVLAGAFYNALAEQMGGLTVRTSVPAARVAEPVVATAADAEPVRAPAMEPQHDEPQHDEPEHEDSRERELALAAAFASVTRNGNGLSNGNGHSTNGQSTNGNGQSTNGNGHSQNGHRAASPDVAGLD